MEKQILNKKTKIKQWANQLAVFAQQSVLYEAILFPKPGLVDSMDKGSHKDMDIFTFMDSSSSLYEGFYQYAKAGITWENSLKKLFEHIRPIGVELEKQMLRETKGINTHKGIIFSMGIFLAATGYLLKNKIEQNEDFPTLTKKETDNIFAIIKEMTCNLVLNDFKDLNLKKYLTNGEKLYLEYGFAGIRGEAEKGYPCIQRLTLPLLRRQNKMYTLSDSLLEILFSLMSSIEDSNVVHRGGIKALEFVKEKAAEFMDNGGLNQENALKKIEEMNQLFILKNISPGGSADLLIITIFLGKLEKLV